MKAIITSALVISGLTGSALADLDVTERSFPPFASTNDRQEFVAPKEHNLGDSFTGIQGFKVSPKTQPKLARSNSFEEDKGAQAFRSTPKAEVVVKQSWFQRAWSWITSCFGF